MTVRLFVMFDARQRRAGGVAGATARTPRSRRTLGVVVLFSCCAVLLLLTRFGHAANLAAQIASVPVPAALVHALGVAPRSRFDLNQHVQMLERAQRLIEQDAAKRNGSGGVAGGVEHAAVAEQLRILAASADQRSQELKRRQWAELVQSRLTGRRHVRNKELNVTVPRLSDGQPHVLRLSFPEEIPIPDQMSKLVLESKQSTKRISIDELNSMRASVDLIYTWVNGSEETYLYRKADAVMAAATRLAPPLKSGNLPTGVVPVNVTVGSRERDSGELRASLRSVKKNMAWHSGRIIVVSPGHVPDWLSLLDPRVHVIHQDVLAEFDGQRYTANTNTIEPLLHRLPNVSEFYVQINDDCIVAQPSSADQLFDAANDGLPAFLFENSVISPIGYMANPVRRNKAIWLSSVYTTAALVETQAGRGQRHYLKHAPFTMSTVAAKHIYDKWRGQFHETAKRHPTRNGNDVLFPFLHHHLIMDAPGSDPIKAAVAESGTTFRGAVGRIGARANASLVVLRDGPDDTIETQLAVSRYGHSTTFVTINDGFRNATVARYLRRHLDAWFTEPAPWEAPSAFSTVADKQSRVESLRQQRQQRLWPADEAMLFVMSVTSCSAACAAVRSLETMGFPAAPLANSLLVVVGAGSCIACPGGRRSRNFDQTFAFTPERVQMLSPRHGQASDVVAQMLASSCAPGNATADQLDAGTTDEIHRRCAAASTVVLIESLDPIFGEVVTARHLTRSENETDARRVVRLSLSTTWRAATDVLALPRGDSDRSYLLTFPLPRRGAAFEHHVPM